MSPEKKKPGRPVVGSRNPTGRPRKVAGRREDQAPEEARPAEEEPRDAAPVPVEPAAAEPEPAAADPEPRPGRAPAGLRTTLALVVALVLLVGIAAAESWYLWLRDDPVVSADRPVVIGEVAHRSAVEAARSGVEEILSYGYQDFDEQIDLATTKMTDAFAEEFRTTAEAVEERFVRQRTEQDFRVVAASVVRASPEKVQALLFMDQYVVRPKTGTTRTPYRALVTMEHTDAGWLVSDIETQ